MRRTILLTTVLLCFFAAPAIAQPGLAAPGQATPYSAPPPTFIQQQQGTTTVTTTYGWQVFAADAASWLVIAAAADESEGLATVGMLGVFLGGPIVHLSQGNSSGAGYSLMARLGLPLGGALLGAATCDGDGSNDGFQCLGSIFLGTMVGYGSALVIDWVYLAKKTKVETLRGGWASLRPSLQVTDTGAQAGFALNF